MPPFSRYDKRSGNGQAQALRYSSTDVVCPLARIVVLSRRGLRHPLGGGASRYVHEILRRLRDRHSVTVLSDCGADSATVEIIDGITYRNLSGPLNRLMLPVRFVAKYAKRADLLIDNADVGMPWMSPLFSPIPRLTIIHQLVREIFYDELPRPLADLGFRVEPLLYLPYRNSKVVAVSQSTARDLIGYGVRKESIDIIEPGTSNEGRSSRALENRAQGTLVCVSRLMKYKGIQLAFDALRRILQLLPDTKLIVAGSGPYETSLHDCATRMGISKNVRFLGKVSDPEKFELFMDARVALSPSMREGFGISVIEANSVGTPVVAWDVPGSRDAIVNNETGLLAPFPDAKAFADHLLTLLSDDDSWNRLSQSALKWSAAHSWDQAADRFDRSISDSLSRIS